MTTGRLIGRLGSLLCSRLGMHAMFLPPPPPPCPLGLPLLAPCHADGAAVKAMPVPIDTVRGLPTCWCLGSGPQRTGGPGRGVAAIGPTPSTASTFVPRQPCDAAVPRLACPDAFLCHVGRVFVLRSKLLGASSLLLVGTYPLMKRVTFWVGGWVVRGLGGWPGGGGRWVGGQGRGRGRAGRG